MVGVIAFSTVLPVPVFYRYRTYSMRNNSHSAPSAMAAAIKKHYWWPTIAADCKATYDHCHICKRTKHRSAKPYGNLQRMAPPMEPGVSYGIDFLTALPPSGAERYTWCRVHRPTAPVPGLTQANGFP